MIGNRRLMDAQSIELSTAINKQIEREEAEGKTVVIVAKETSVIGYLVINDMIREEVKTALTALKHNGARDLVMLIGDNEKTAQYVAKQLGITSVRAELQLKDKLEEIKQR